MLRIGLVAAASLIGGSAFAADMARPYLPPAAMAPRAVFDRTGFTIGAKADGFGVARNMVLSFNDADLGSGPRPAAFDNRPSGTPGGVETSVTSHVASFVYGLETDFELAGITGSIDAPTCPAALCGVALGTPDDQRSPWSGGVRGRIADVAGWLLFVTGSYAYARLDTNAIAGAGGVGATFDATDTRSEWTSGGGAKIDYLDLDFGDTHARIPFGRSLPVVSPMNRF